MTGGDGGRSQGAEVCAVLDAPHGEVFDRITRIAAALVDVPIALVSVLDDGRQWFRAKVGTELDDTPNEISFCQHVVDNCRPMVIPDTHLDPRFRDNPLVLGEPYVRFYAGIPLVVADQSRVGTLCVIDRKPRQLSKGDLQVLQDLAMVAVRELDLKRVAMTDPLTGAFNRRMLEFLFGQEVARMTRQGDHPLSFAILDLDHFKALNDKHGHDAGDAVLTAVVASFNKTLRSVDTLFRIGGEEFAILMPGTDLKSAAGAIERVRQALAQSVMRHDGQELRVTTSAGVATYHPDDTNLTYLMARADAALFRAKAGGRDRVAVSDRNLAV